MRKGKIIKKVEKGVEKGVKKVEEAAEESVSEFNKALATLIISAFGFVAALLWKDVTQSFFTEVLGLEWGTDFVWTFVIAMCVTVFLVALTLILTKFVHIKVKK